ncbi:unnamed protein product, partial [Mycena citricolor]
ETCRRKRGENRAWVPAHRADVGPAHEDPAHAILINIIHTRYRYCATCIQSGARHGQETLHIGEGHETSFV